MFAARIGARRNSMKSLLMIRKRTDAPRRLSFLNIVRTTALLTIGAFSLNALGQTATCEFDEVTEGTNWQVVGNENQIVFYQGTGATVTIPNFNDDGCVGSGDTSFRLFKNGVQVTDLTDGTEDDVIRLLRRVTGVTVTDVGVTATDGDSGWGDEHTITYDGTNSAWGAAPVEYTIQAARAFTDVLGEFTFTVTVAPTALVETGLSPVAKAESTETIVVSWTGDDTGNATHYQVAWRQNGQSSYTMSGLIEENTPSSETAHIYSIHGLEANTGYDIAVRSVNPGSMADMYDDAYSPFARVTYDAAEHTTKNPQDDAMNAINDMNPIRIATGQTVSIDAMDWLYPHVVGTTDTVTGTAFHATGTTFTYNTRSGNNSALRVEFINDGDANTDDHVIRLTGLAEADTYAVVTAEGMDGSELRTEIPVKVGTNAEQIFSVVSATSRWDLETTGADFEVDASDFVSTADDTIEYSMTGGTHRGVTYLEIAEDTGVISVPSGTNLSPLESGDEFELTVTATNGNQGTDSMVIYVDVVEGDDAPFLKPGTGDVWLKPLAEANGGGSRVVNLSKYFDDRDGGRLCFDITGDTTDIGTASNPMVVADARLAGASQCKNAQLTVEMNLPSQNPASDNFSLLGLRRVVEVEVDVAAYQEGDSTNTSDPVTVKIKLAYGRNSSPSIRAVAKAGNVYIASGGWTVDENEAFTITFTADDPLPTDDELCWSDKGMCTPCVGPDLRKSSRTQDNGVSHEFDLTVPAAKVDYEKNRDGYVIDLCATDLTGATHTTEFTVIIDDVEEPPTFKPIDDMYFVVGDYAQSIDLADFVQDGDGARDIVSYDANTVGSSTAVEVSESDGVVTVEPTDSTLARKAEVEIEVSATDTSGYRAYGYFTAHVKNSNRSPTFPGGLGSVTYAVAENTPARTNIGSRIEADDPDVGDTITYELSGSSMFSLTTSGDTAQIVLAKSGLDYEGGIRSYDLIVTASDGYGGAATLDVTINVTDVNEPPIATDEVIPDQRILLGMTQCVIRASEHFSDPDESDKAAGLLIEATSTRPGDVAVTIRNNEDVCIEGKNVGTGPARITVTAEDRQGNSVYKRFKATVEQNNPPMTAASGALPDMEVQLDGRSNDFDLYEYFDDGDATYDETMTFTVTADDNDIATGTIVRQKYLRVYGNRAGTVMLKVTATDQNNQTHSQTFSVTVIRNDPPVANHNAIDDVVTRVGVQPDQIDAGDAFTDEGDSFTLSIGTDDPDVATLSIDYDEDMNPWITVMVHSVGSTQATLTAVDTDQNTSTITFTITVGPRNDPPILLKAIEDVTIAMDERYDIELDEIFEDEGRLDIEIEIEDDNVADVIYRRSMNILRVYGYVAGDTLVTVTATDDIDQSVTDEFIVTVARGSAPVVNAVPVDQTGRVDDMTTVSMTGVFMDADGDTLTYAAESSDEGVAVVTVTGNIVEITGVTEGTAMITVTAMDPEGLTAEVSFNVIIGPADMAPVLVIPLSDLTLEMGKEADISMDGVFEDDGELSYSISFEDDEIAHGVYRAGTNTIRVYGDEIGETTATVTATDEVGQSASDSFEVEVLVPNYPPVVVGTIDDGLIEVGEHTDVSIDGIFTDEGELTYSASSADDEIADAFYRASTNSVRVYGIGVGMTTITVTATDDVGQVARAMFNMEVEPANDPPVVAMLIPNQTMTVVEPLMVSISGVFMDPDGDPMTFTVMSSNTAAATASLNGMDITLTGVKVGMTTITVTAADPEGLSATTTFEAEVENAAPMVVGEIEDQTLNVVDPAMVSIDGLFMDPDGDTLTYSVESSNTDAATVAISGMDVTITGVKVGMTMITVTATDPDGLYAMETFDAVVENSAPMVMNEIEDQTLTVVEPAMVSIADTFYDPDGDDLTYSVESSNTDAATVMVDGMDVTITGVKVGMTTITVTATDPDGLYAMTTFEAEVENAAPMMVGTLDDQEVTRGEPMTVSIAGVFMDPDGDMLTNTASSDDATVASVSVSGDDVTINGLAPGTAMITVTASDPMGLSASGSFMVTVETIPEAVGTIADVTLQVGGEAMNMNIAQYFEDDDGDALTYAVASEGEAATVELSGTDLSLAPMTKGSTSITLTASDPKGRSATQAFMAMVSDSEIKAVGASALAGAARAMISSAGTAIGSRIEGNRGDTSSLSFLPMVGGSSEDERIAAYNASEVSARHGVTTSANRAGPVVQNSVGAGARNDPNGVDWGTVASNSNTRSTEATMQSLVGNGFSQFLNGDGGLGSISGWGAVDFQTFEGLGYEGNATAFFLGADVMISPHVLLGAAVAHNRSESDYTYGTATQTLETTTTSVMPYGAYKPNPKAVIWGVVGRGGGEATTTVVNSSNESSDLTTSLGMFGASARFASQGRMEFGIRGDAAFANMETDDGTGAADALEAAVNRARLGLEAAMHYSSPGGPTITPYGELNLRYDGGDGVTGSGVEVAGGLRINTSNFELDARGHTVAAHSGDDFAESGFSLMATFNPNRTMNGLSISIAPSWGQTSRSQSVVWTNSNFDQMPFNTGGGLGVNNGLTMNANVGYGMFVNHDRFLLTPYFEYSQSSKDNTSMLLGAELKQLIMSSSLVDMNFTLGRTDSGFGSEGNQLEINATIQF
ncbi:MAG: hypothetical protein F4Z66_07040 [Gammaproteobacteria bacterium]|nr:hypothetical protein [Gammaproteobacteria bacterium]